ncbi:MAG: hypothetical protein COB30_010145 [Ectothiorhodospiraceae bacterium]|nr:hypothetical protein [Ectothiorhodospiraceae bacterium]
MSTKRETIERLSARLDEESQEKAGYLISVGFGPTDLVREGIDLLYQKTINAKQPSIPALLKSLSLSTGEGPSDLAKNHKKYFKEHLIEKRTG